MHNLTTFNEIAEPVTALSECVIDNLLTVESNNDSEAWLALLRQYVFVDRERVVDTYDNSEDVISSPEIVEPLQPVAAGPWRSLGGFMDYTGWAARERFLELDEAIAGGQYLRERAA